MERLHDCLENEIGCKHWSSALVLALTLIDISAKNFSSSDSPTARYVEWYNQFLLPTYTGKIGPNQQKQVFLSGEDCYALRCSLLHEGKTEISRQRIQKALNDFDFRIPPATGSIHMNLSNDSLQLQIDIFLKDVLNSCRKWWKSLTEKHKADIDSSLLQIREW